VLHTRDHSAHSNTLPLACTSLCCVQHCHQICPQLTLTSANGHARACSAVLSRPVDVFLQSRPVACGRDTSRVHMKHDPACAARCGAPDRSCACQHGAWPLGSNFHTQLSTGYSCLQYAPYSQPTDLLQPQPLHRLPHAPTFPHSSQARGCHGVPTPVEVTHCGGAPGVLLHTTQD
jgi:hypothetical protein